MLQLRFCRLMQYHLQPQGGLQWQSGVVFIFACLLHGLKKQKKANQQENNKISQSWRGLKTCLTDILSVWLEHSLL